KDIFIAQDMRKDFNVPKVHSIQHYAPAVINFGSVGTDGLECLHFDMTKMALRASTCKGSQYVCPMYLRLTHRGKVRRLDTYSGWVSCEIASTCSHHV
ncbi:hypothetical protein PENSPDRAFT_573247, partial [Peniophora sp. CONT]